MVVKGKSCRQTFQMLIDFAEEIVVKYKANINGGPDKNPTNWPINVIVANSMYRSRSAIEKREKSVQLTTRLIGETKEILKILEQHQLLYADQFTSIDEWLMKMGQANSSSSLSSSRNDFHAFGSSELATDDH
ncbi:hypothetical protein LOK49_Contig341G00003 [Camellia lanceoleosa]|nr:hypothetical protein LOK49_Contig341G00003 [Camellia lanceoleosa]